MMVSNRKTTADKDTEKDTQRVLTFCCWSCNCPRYLSYNSYFYNSLQENIQLSVTFTKANQLGQQYHNSGAKQIVQENRKVLLPAFARAPNATVLSVSQPSTHSIFTLFLNLPKVQQLGQESKGPATRKGCERQGSETLGLLCCNHSSKEIQAHYEET